MLMIKTGAPAGGPSMGKGLGQGSNSLGNEFSSVLNALMNKAPAATGNRESSMKSLMAAMNLETIPGRKSGDVLKSLAAVVSGDTTSKSADLYMGAKGLDVLGQLLEKAGLPADQVKTYIDGQKQGLSESDSLTPFKTVLSNLGEFMQDNDQGTWLDISSLPYIQTALTGFGFTPEKIETILFKATDKTQGVSVDKLLAELEPYTASTSTKAITAFPADEKAPVLPWTVKKIKNETALKTDDAAAFPASGESFISDSVLAMLAGLNESGNSSPKNTDTPSSHTFKKIDSGLKTENADHDSSVSSDDTKDSGAVEPSQAPPMSFPAAMIMDLLSPRPATTTGKPKPLAETAPMSAAMSFDAAPAATFGMPHPLAETAPMAEAMSFTAASESFAPTVQTSQNRADAPELLDAAAKGNISLKDFAAKLETLAEGGTPAASKQAAIAPLAQAFHENIHTINRKVAASGSESARVMEPVSDESTNLTFDTSRPLPTLFTEKAQGIFKGHVQTERSDNDSKTVKNPVTTGEIRAEGQHQAAEPVAPFMRNNQGKNFSAHDGESFSEAYASHPEKPLKEKMPVREGKIESQTLPVRILTGSGIYAKTSEMVQAGPSEKTLPAYVTDQVARQISKAVKNGDTEIRFHIKPPDMGRVELSITHTSGGLKVSILAEHSTTRDMIMNQSTDLKTLLADQGIRIEKMDVGMSGDFGQSMAQAKHDSDSSNRGRKQKDKPLFSFDPLSPLESKDTSTAAALMAAGGYTRGRLDLVA